ncbi:MAG: sensor histidine kinase [Lachnospiraceae bacterium]|nr:sensor histidine kinase [Lachnospiraceae bacterium]
METSMAINNTPHADELWAGIGGHFDSLGQIVNEFIDNCISNFTGNNTMTRNIIISLVETTVNGDVKISIEDSGTGIKKLNEAFTLGSCAAAESPLNEHGFGLKHALASANPANDSWVIYTRTQEDIDTQQFKKIEAPYKIENFSAKICTNEKWPGKLNGTGTIIQFTCKKEMYKTIAKGLRGGISNFRSIADILCEDIGFIYSGVIEENRASITLDIADVSGDHINRSVGAVKPDWEDYIKPGSGSQEVNLGNGRVTIDYKFGKINKKQERLEFDNTTARKYYQKSMSTSGVEIRINGRVLCYNLFKEIWGIEKHNSYNYLLVCINLKSLDREALPKTRTSKNGLREGDEKLEKLYEWIRSNLNEPVKDVTLSDHETDLFELLRDRIEQYDSDPNKLVKTEYEVFVSTGNTKDRVRADLYYKNTYGITIYEGKKEETTSKDVYQLRMYWDGLVYDGITPTKGILLANTHPNSVKELISIVNNMYDAKGNKYNFETKTWQQEGIVIQK